MKGKQRSHRFAFLPLITVLVAILACQSGNIFSVPTQTPYPTYTPYPTLPTTPPPKEALFEDFKGYSSCFEPYLDVYMSAQMENGAFSLKIDKSEQSVWSLCQNQTFRDFIYEVDVSVPKDASGAFYYGVVFRESGSQYYDFIVSKALDGTPVFCVSYINNDTYTPLTNSTFDPGNCWVKIPANVYESRKNTFRVSAEDDLIQVHLNGEILALIRDNLVSVGRIGFVAGTFDQEELQVVYDNLRVTEP